MAPIHNWSAAKPANLAPGIAIATAVLATDGALFSQVCMHANDTRGIGETGGRPQVGALRGD
jgi:hypothetical protein